MGCSLRGSALQIAWHIKRKPLKIKLDYTQQSRLRPELVISRAQLSYAWRLEQGQAGQGKQRLIEEQKERHNIITRIANNASYSLDLKITYSFYICGQDSADPFT